MKFARYPLKRLKGVTVCKVHISFSSQKHKTLCKVSSRRTDIDTPTVITFPLYYFIDDKDPQLYINFTKHRSK